MLLTFERTDYARRTLQAFFERATLPEGAELRVHIADDGSSEDHRNALANLVAEQRHLTPVSMTNSARGGYGANYNLATQVVHEVADVVLPLEDDWELTRPFDFGPMLRDLTSQETFGCIRLGYIGFTQPLRAEFINYGPRHYLLLDPASEEPHVWAGHPRLETVAWQKAVGPWPEGYDPGSTEFLVAQRPKTRGGVVWPVDEVAPYGSLFGHIGTIQARSDQQEAVI